MQKIEKILIGLLGNHNCVVLPGFGAFLAEREGAWIHPVTQRFYPPKKRIAFNVQLTLNDGLLQTHLTMDGQMTQEKALHEVQQYVQKVSEIISSQKSYTFPGIGRCYLNPTGQLEFEPDADLNLLEESFGMSEVFFKPLDTTIMSQRPVRPVVRRPGATNPPTNKETPNTESETKTKSSKEKQPSGGGAGKLVLILLPLFLLVSAGGTLLYLKQNGRSLASLNPFATEEIAKATNEPSSTSETSNDTASSAESITADTSITSSEEFSNEIETVVSEAPSKSTLAEKQDALSQKESQNKEGLGSNVSHHGRYFVVIGSFIDRSNAVNLRNKMAARGLNVTLIERTKDSRFYKVAIDDFESEEEAIRRKKELEGQFGNEVWVMSY